MRPAIGTKWLLLESELRPPGPCGAARVRQHRHPESCITNGHGAQGITGTIEPGRLDQFGAVDFAAARPVSLLGQDGTILGRWLLSPAG